MTTPTPMPKHPLDREWEFLASESEEEEISFLDRMRVPGGWIYRHRTWQTDGPLLKTSIVFAPDGPR